MTTDDFSENRAAFFFCSYNCLLAFAKDAAD